MQGRFGGHGPDPWRRHPAAMAGLVTTLALLAAASCGSGAGLQSARAAAGAQALAWFDGRPLPQDGPAYMVNGTLMLPVRVFEHVGARVTWDAASRSSRVAVGERSVRMTAGKTTVTVTGGARALGMPEAPELSGGRLMVPVRAVAEALGFQVSWDDEAGTIHLRTPAAPPAPQPKAPQPPARPPQEEAPTQKARPAAAPATPRREAASAATATHDGSEAHPLPDARPAPEPSPAAPVGPASSGSRPIPAAPPPLPAPGFGVREIAAAVPPPGDLATAAPALPAAVPRVARSTSGAEPSPVVASTPAEAKPVLLMKAPEAAAKPKSESPVGQATEAPFPPAAEGEVTGVLVRRDGGRTRIDVLSDGPVRLKEQPVLLQEPARLVLDIEAAALSSPTTTYPASGSLVKGVRLGQPSPGIVRVAVDLVHAVGYSVQNDPSDGHVFVTLNYAVTQVNWLWSGAGRGQLWVEMSGMAPVRTGMLSDPLRLAFDIQQATLVAPPGEWEVSSGPVRRYRVSQFQPGVVRVVLDLNEPIDPHVVTSLDLTRDLLASRPSSEGAPLPGGAGAASGKAPAIDLVLDVYSRIVDVAVKALGPGGASVVVEATGPVEPKAFYLRNPDRLVLDIPGAVVDPLLAQRLGAADASTLPAGGPARDVRVGQFLPRSARVVVELERPIGYRLFSSDEKQTTVVALGSQPLAGRVVAIDPGHGGHDPGAIAVSGTPEKAYNLDIARRVAKLLDSVGVETTLTRGEDVFVELDERVAIADRVRAEVFVSIHHNASTSRTGSGTEVFYSPNDSQSQRLAELLFDSLVERLDTPGRGIVLRRDLRVLRLASMPAALVEVAFVDNPSEERRLADPEFRQQAADAIFGALVSFLSQAGDDTVKETSRRAVARGGPDR